MLACGFYQPGEGPPREFGLTDNRPRRAPGSPVAPLPPRRAAHHAATEPVWDPKAHKQSWRAVWAYSAKRAARDHKTLTRQENKAKAVVAGQKAARTPRFVKTTNGTIRLDEAALARARRLVGLKGYLSNLPATIMPASELISSYHSLWQVLTWLTLAVAG